MTQDERWLTRYNEVKGFIETNHRNPSSFEDELVKVNMMFQPIHPLMGNV